MSSRSISSGLLEASGFLGGVVKQVRLGWRLFKDSRVPGWVKMIPIAGLLYFLSPVDLIPDFVLPGLGEVDDVLLLLLALKMLVDLSPQGIVQEHLENLFGVQGRTDFDPETSSSSYIDAPYRVLDNNE